MTAATQRHPAPSAGSLAAQWGMLRLLGGAVATTAALVLGALAATPIYQTGWVWVVAAAALILGAGLAWARVRWRLTLPVFAALMLGVFVLSLVPVAVPQLLLSDPIRGLRDGLAAVALGWKQLLTLTLPVGTYQTVLVPLYVVLFVTALLIMTLAQRSGRTPILAAIPMLAPVAFGTIFGASAVSDPFRLGPLTVHAPREIALWLAAAALAGGWVAWTAGAQRRAALRLGRVAGDRHERRGGAFRLAAGGGVLVAALAAGLVVAPLLDADARAVPRDAVDPALIITDRPSPLAAYRNAKRDTAIDEPLFTVSTETGLPERLRLAVLDAYDGVDFHVSADAAGRFTRFPSGEQPAQPSRVSIEVRDGYQDIWAPTAGLGAPPTFTGPRAGALADAFYVNRATEAAIAAPGARGAGGAGAAVGLAAGDGYQAEMDAAAPAPPSALGAPLSSAPLIDLEQVPELARWIDRQALPADAEGFTRLAEMLRERGYLSHAMSESAGETRWLARLAEEYGTVFEASAGGHSLARVEAMFTQLNAQQSAAGEDADSAQLVAAVGDDEQFAAATALLARALGYDSRVVIGVRLGGAEVPGVPTCQAECTGDHLAAWVEVRGDGNVWVPFDVTPQVSQQPQRLEQGEQLPEFPTTPEERDAQEVDPPIGLGEQGEGSPSDPEAIEASWLGPILRAVGLAAAAIALIALPIFFLPVAKRIRAHHRRRAAAPELRALGAWEEFVDRARDAGVRIPDRASRTQVAAAIGSPAAARAAAQVDRAVFSAHGIGEADAEALWRATDTESAERAAGLSLGQRIRAAYSLRSYGINIGGRRPRPEGGTS
ncbi:MAG: transglutaminase domain-containing protein [Leucobacter sp.]